MKTLSLRAGAILIGLLLMPANSRGETLAESLDRLVKAYPEALSGHDDRDLFWRDGTKMPVGDGNGGKSFDDLLRNASIPVITVAALEISNLLAGAVIVENVFAWPGLGLLTVQSIVARDFLDVQGVVILGAFVTIALNGVTLHQQTLRSTQWILPDGTLTPPAEHPAAIPAGDLEQPELPALEEHSVLQPVLRRSHGF